MDQKFSLSTLLNYPLISRVRRNHALEHAAMQVLAERRRDLHLMAHSSVEGFSVYGDVTAEELFSAAQEGLRRLQAGRHELAIHSRCGTNYAIAGILAGFGAFAALTIGMMSASRRKNRLLAWLDWLSYLPMACSAATLGIILAQPLGPYLQARITTQAEIGGLRIVGITQKQQAGMLVHHVRTAG